MSPGFVMVDETKSYLGIASDNRLIDRKMERLGGAFNHKLPDASNTHEPREKDQR